LSIVPGFHTLFSSFNSAAAPEKGTVNTATSHAAAAEGLSNPSTCALLPIRSCKSFAASCARVASREPIRMCSPAFARRYASPEPSAPVPPRIAIFRAMNVHPVFNQAAQTNRRQGNSDPTRRFAFPAASMVSSKTSKMPTSSLSSSEFRKALGHFTTGVTVVTVEQEPGKIHGMTANSFTSVSLDPMLVLVCVDHRANMHPLLQKKKKFGVSVLKQNQQAVSEYFAKREHNAETEQRLGIHFRRTPSGAPVIDGTLLQMSCKVIASHVAGDHTIFIGEVEDAELHEGEPLLYFRGEYRKI